MLEHIFRNINDIRVFDIMVEFILNEEDEKKDFEELSKMNNIDFIDFDNLVDMLEYPEYKRIELEDSLDHLVRQKILGIRKIRMDATTGCEICKYSDKFGYERLYGHRDHVAEQINVEYVNNYYMENNRTTGLLRNAIFNHILTIVGGEHRGEYDE